MSSQFDRQLLKVYHLLKNSRFRVAHFGPIIEVRNRKGAEVMTFKDGSGGDEPVAPSFASDRGYQFLHVLDYA